MDRGPQQLRLKVMEKEMKQHEIRKLSVSDDADVKSLAEMNVWDMIKADNNRRSLCNKYNDFINVGGKLELI